VASDDLGVRFVVTGRVQGVGFRWWVARKATEIGVRGWVRNLEDGSVEVTARGAAHSIATLSGLLARGPRLSRVDNVEKSDSPHEISGCKSFEIR